MRVFSYKMVRDFGFAPNPFHGVCTLATCKPAIRKAAEPGDIVVGCGSSKTPRAGRVVYAMRVGGKCGFQEYWEDSRFAAKRPGLHAGRARVFGDNIYHRGPDGRWVQEDSHHSHPDGSLNEDNLRQDTRVEDVLWADDFAYFGRDAPLVPDHLRNFDGEDLYPDVRDRRCRFSTGFVQAVAEWFDALPRRGYLGRPADWT